MRLSEILHGVSHASLPAADPEIAGLTADSRAVGPGFLFAALPGSRLDGRDFIGDAVARGAVAVLAPPGTALPSGAAEGAVRLVPADNPRRSFALLASLFFNAQPQIAAAVTGTNGKTSVAWFTQQIWAALGHTAAAMGTLGITPDAAGAVAGDAAPALTTADPVALHRCLARLAGGGIDHLVLEASSHGLEQFRLDGVALKAGAFTNVSRDHLDYHGTMESYRAAKLRLFEVLLPRDAAAVLNADAEDFAAFHAAATGGGRRIITYGRGAADIRVERTTPGAAGQTLALSLFGRDHVIELPLVGGFQVANALCALGLAIACGDDAEAALPALGALRGAPGRIELSAQRRNGAPVYVDYAHTPDALANVLAALRPHAARRLVVVFGCGGDRDAGKRPEMGRIAGALADTVIVTDDNPRSEDAAAIRSQILAACPDAIEIGDRAEAIYAGAVELEDGDILVIAGKGHETGQIVAGETLPFVDAEVARAAVAAIDGSAA